MLDAFLLHQPSHYQTHNHSIEEETLVIIHERPKQWQPFARAVLSSPTNRMIRPEVWCAVRNPPCYRYAHKISSRSFVIEAHNFSPIFFKIDCNETSLKCSGMSGVRFGLSIDCRTVSSASVGNFQTSTSLSLTTPTLSTSSDSFSVLESIQLYIGPARRPFQI